MRLYLVHDEEYCYRVVIKASSNNDAIEKLHKWFKESKKNGEFFNSKNVKWIAELCDNVNFTDETKTKCSDRNIDK